MVESNKLKEQNLAKKTEFLHYELGKQQMVAERLQKKAAEQESSYLAKSRELDRVTTKLEERRQFFSRLEDEAKEMTILLEQKRKQKSDLETRNAELEASIAAKRAAEAEKCDEIHRLKQ